MDSVKSTLKAIVNDSRESATNKYTIALKKHVTQQGWPSHIVNRIKISFDKPNHKISYPPDLEDEIHRLQYGTPENNFEDKNDAFMSFTLERNYSL